MRWLLLLSAAVYGVFYATERGLAWEKKLKTRLVFETTTANITVLSVKIGQQEVTFARQDSFWLGVQGHITTRVPDSTLQALLGPLRALHSTQARWTEVQAVQPIVVVTLIDAQGGKHVLEYLYEDFDATFQTPITWVRIDQQQSVFAVKGHFVSYFNIDFQSFRPKKIWQVSADSIASIMVYRATDTLSWVAQNGRWWAKQTASDSVLLRQVLALTTLSAGRFYDQSRSVLGTPLRTHRVVLGLKNTSDSLVVNYFKLDTAWVVQAIGAQEVCFWLDSLPLK